MATAKIKTSVRIDPWVLEMAKELGISSNRGLSEFTRKWQYVGMIFEMVFRDRSVEEMLRLSGALFESQEGQHLKAVAEATIALEDRKRRARAANPRSKAHGNAAS